jgi:hypothetical protein
MAKLDVTVSVKDDHLPRFGELVEHMKKSGLDVERQLQSAGVVTGKIDAEKLAQLRTLNGIGSVEGARSYQIAPPDSEIQ